MKLCLLALAAVLALLSPAGCAEAQSSLTGARAPVRYVEHEGRFASGIVLAPGILLTAHHIIEVAPKVTVNGGKTPAVIIAMANGDPLDIAVVRYPASEAACPCAKIARYPAMPDEPVWIVGYPFSIGQVVTPAAAQGTFDVQQPQPLGRRLVITASVHSGNSGGGVFVYRDGEFQLVGMLIEGLQGLAFAVPLDDIKGFIAEHESKF